MDGELLLCASFVSLGFYSSLGFYIIMITIVTIIIFYCISINKMLLIHRLYLLAILFPIPPGKEGWGVSEGLFGTRLLAVVNP